jgi:phosphatidylserine/phosphatidylglycerophosphate/cardiolipin synthase-like enzyme
MAEEAGDTSNEPILTPAPPRPRRVGRYVFWTFIAIWAGTALFNIWKPLPEGTSVRGAIIDTPLEEVEFLADLTSADAFGQPVVRQQIFDSMLELIRNAREYLVLDFFLFNPQRGSMSDTAPYRALSGELREALLARKRENPELKVLVLADPINDVYGGLPSREFAQLREAGIDVVTVDLDPLRDSNAMYSALWRLTTSWWTGGEDATGGWLPNPLEAGPEQVSFGSWARLLNFKADHRKVLLGDDGRGGIRGILTSANPHDASSLHSNVAIRLSGGALESLLASELAIARNSGWEQPWQPRQPGIRAAERSVNTARVQVLTEGEIGSAVLRNIEGTGANDAIDIAMFYLSERNIIEALLAASRRGATVRVLLDPNKDAFGREKSGIPNRPVAAELGAASDGAIKVRWYRTHGEQFHSKLVAIRSGSEVWITLGSANLTRRNVGDYNLEANIGVTVPTSAAFAIAVTDWFDLMWSNRGAPAMEYTADYGTYADPAQTSYWLYRIMESTGLCTF